MKTYQALKTYVYIFSLFLLFSCNVTKEATKKITKEVSNLNENIEKRKWRKELLASGNGMIERNYYKQIGGAIGREFKENETVPNWLKENPNKYFSLSDKIEVYRGNFAGDAAEDLLLTMCLDPSVGGNWRLSTLLKLVYKDGEDVLNNNTLSKRIEEKIFSHYQNLLKDKQKRLLFIVTGFDKTLNGEYEIWKKGDAHCCPSIKGKFRYNLKKKIMNIIPKNDLNIGNKL